MRFFELIPDEDRLYKRYTLDVSHKWSLPGVQCGVCGWIGEVCSNAYPSVRLPDGVDAGPYQNRWPVSPERIRQLMVPLRPVIPSAADFGAGTEFGPLTGQFKGTLDPVSWAPGATMLVSKRVMRELQALCLCGLVGVETEVTTNGGDLLEHIEMEVPALVRLDPEHLPERGLDVCPECGVLNIHQSDDDWDLEVTFVKDSMPADRDIARVKELEGTIIVTERFVEATRKLRLSGMIFREVLF